MQALSSYRPALVSWNLTKRCNLRCPHCYLSAGKKAERELETGECLALLDEMREQGTEMVILTGGEPLLRRELERLVAMLAPLEGLSDLTLTTNGSNLAADSRGDCAEDNGARKTRTAQARMTAPSRIAPTPIGDLPLSE